MAKVSSTLIFSEFDTEVVNASNRYSLLITQIPTPTPASPPNIVRLNGVDYPSISAALATVSSGPQTLTFTTAADTVETGAISLPSALTSLEIDGQSGTGTLIIGPSGTNPLFTYNGSEASDTLRLNNITISGFSHSSVFQAASGGVIYTPHPLTLSGSAATFNKNLANGDGGVINAYSVTASGSMTFNQNTANGSGGAIKVSGGVTLVGADLISFSRNMVNTMNGGAICGDVTIASGQSLPVTFSQNQTTGNGGAIYGAATLQGSGQVDFNGNSSSNSNGGAIYGNGSGDVTISNPTTFTDNRVTSGAINSGLGGAIYANNNLTLTDILFKKNYAVNTGTLTAGVGGAVYMGGTGNFTYKISNGNVVTLNADAPTSITQIIPGPVINGTPTSTTQSFAVTGNNDFASVIGAMFKKQGTGSLTLNTINSGWKGSTTINEGSLIIGGDAAHSTAVWGETTPTSSTSIIVNGSATLGGYGTINAYDLTFGANSTWRLCPGGSISIQGNLTLNSQMRFEVGPLPQDFPTGDGYSVATLVAGGGLVANLPDISAKLAQYNLMLHSPGVSRQLFLKKLPASTPTSTGMITFQAPAYYPGTTNYLTNYGQGLLVRYGTPGTGGNFFNAAGSIHVAHLTCSDGSWTGSSVLLPSGTYNWQLWKTRDYQGDDIESSAANAGWIAQHRGATIEINPTLSITPGEGAER